MSDNYYSNRTKQCYPVIFLPRKVGFIWFCYSRAPLILNQNFVEIPYIKWIKRTNRRYENTDGTSYADGTNLITLIKSTFEQLEFWMIYELEIKIYNKLEYFRKSSICARVIFFYLFTTLRNQAWDLQLYLKRDSSTGVFLWILQIFKNTFFYRTPRVVLST